MHHQPTSCIINGARKLPPILLVLLMVVCGTLIGRGSELPEYDVKAAFLFNFIQFVEWPQKAFSSPNAPLVIGIYGSDPFGGSLERIIHGEVIRGHKLMLKRFRRPEEIKGCHVLFICRSEASRIDEALALVRGSSVLTVGDADHFVSKGGIIGFTMVDNNVRFQINPGNAQREELVISSRLLRLAIGVP